MTIHAKYAGQCSVCGKRIAAGQSVEWDKASRTIRHPGCTPVTVPADAIRLSGGSGYGCRGWVAGQVVRASKERIASGGPEYLYVLQASSRYYREDGMSFGAGDDQGHTYSALCRPATDEEAAPLRSAPAMP